MLNSMYVRILSFALVFWAGSAGAVSTTEKAEFFETNIRPIFESRCIQCHSCYNSPCQLNLSSARGLERGMVHGYELFNPSRLNADAPSRLGIDRKTTEGWRGFAWNVSFKPVTANTGDAKKNADESLILKLVEHKQANASLAVDDLANPGEKPEDSRSCPDSSRSLSDHLSKRPNAGMPYGLPPLSDDQVAKIREWTEMGSPVPSTLKAKASADAGQIRAIENQLNAYKTNLDVEMAKKQSLVSRYIYEHLFLAQIYLRNERAPEMFYRLIRSSKSCDAADEIPTRRPWDDTNAAFFYCLQPIEETIVHKTHITYMIDEAKLQRWNDLFFSSNWKVTFKAPRDDKQASNPFLVFRDMPAKARYQFLLDDAQYHVMTFIKGPVCKGNTAVNSIDEQFYVFFIKPESELMVRNAKFLKDSIPHLMLPAHKGSSQFLGLIVANALKDARNRYRVMRDQVYGQEFPNGYAISDLWNGNPNSALTVVRHEDSAAVVKGLVGATPKTAFVLDYSIFERFYYDLVAGFDVFGDVSHQVHTRLYMSYIKMEAEEVFLSFLPSNVRAPMRRSWYIDGNSMAEMLLGANKVADMFPLLGANRPTQVPLAPLDQATYDLSGVVGKLTTLRDYRRQLISLFKSYIGPDLVLNNQLNPDKELLSKTSDVEIGQIRSFSEFDHELAKLSDLPAYNSPWVLKMPSASLLLVEGPASSVVYSLARNKEHLNIAWMSGENDRRSEAQDTMMFYKGILTSYPNFIFAIRLDQARDFLIGMMNVHDQASYDAWMREYGNPRSGAGSERFWSSSDRLHSAMKKNYPREYGALDYNRYGSDYRYNDDAANKFFENLPEDLKKSVGQELGAK